MMVRRRYLNWDGCMLLERSGEWRECMSEENAVVHSFRRGFGMPITRKVVVSILGPKNFPLFDESTIQSRKAQVLFLYS